MTVATPVEARSDRGPSSPPSPPLAGSVARSISERSATVGLGLVVLGFLVLVLALTAGPGPAITAFAVVAAGSVGALLVTRPRLVLAVLVVGEVVNASVVLRPLLPFGLQPVLFVLGFVTLVLGLRSPVGRARLRRPVLTPLAVVVLYVVSLVPSVVGSRTPDVTWVVLRSSVQDVVFLALVLLLAVVVEEPWWLIKMVVAPLAVLAVLTLVNQVFLGNATAFGGFARVSDALGELTTTARHAGPTLDPNFWARNQILGLPFAYALCYAAWVRRHRGALVGWSSATLALLLGIYLTQSRGAVVAVAVATVLWVVLAGPTVRRAALVLSPLAVPMLLAPGVGDRLLTLTRVEGSGADLSLVGRVAAQEMGWVMFGDSPVVGLGPGSFLSVIPEYAPMAPATGEINGPLVDAPHNLYLQLAVESGLVGLLGWILLVGSMILLGLVSVTQIAAASPHRFVAERAVAAAGVAAIAGWSVASLFLQVAYVRNLFIVFVVVGFLYRRGQESPSPDAARAAERRAEVLTGGRRLLGAGLIAAACLAAAVMVTGSGRDYVVSQQWTLRPDAPVIEGYALDVRSRSQVVPTFAGLLGRDEPGVTVDGSAASGVITASARDPDLGTAVERIRVMLAGSDSATAWRLAQPGYTVEPLGASTVREERTTSSATLAMALTIAVIGSILTVVVVRRASRAQR
jgi:O-antigen ligase